MMERLLNVQVGPYGTILMEIERICCMTGFRRRLLIHYLGDGSFWSIELEAR